MCIESNALYVMQEIDAKRVSLTPLTDTDKTFLLRNNMQEKIEAHNAYINAMLSLKETEIRCRKQYGDDVINKLTRGMPLS